MRGPKSLKCFVCLLLAALSLTLTPGCAKLFDSSLLEGKAEEMFSCIIARDEEGASKLLYPGSGGEGFADRFAELCGLFPVTESPELELRQYNASKNVGFGSSTVYYGEYRTEIGGEVFSIIMQWRAANGKEGFEVFRVQREFDLIPTETD
ncbi:MAG: hypothetical protein IKG85_06005 [Clostridia bacterium]|nr:hypothetical protein [Clostridia bacterium]